MDPMIKNDGSNTCLIAACFNENPNLDTIKYLAQKVNPFDVNDDKVDCLMATTFTNHIDLNIIKYLIDELKMDANKTWLGGATCLLRACRNGENLEIIKFLISNTKNLNYQNRDGENCLTCAIDYMDMYNQSDDERDYLDVIKFLIDDIDVELVIPRRIQENTFDKIIMCIENDDKMNQLIECMFRRCSLSDIKKIARKINPFRLSDTCLTKLKIDNNSYSYDEFVNLLNQYNKEYKNNNQHDEKDRIREEEKNVINKINSYDFTKPSELLFEHAGNQYHGYREIVFNAMHLFRGFEEHIDGKVTLEGNLPKDVVNKYISSSYTGLFCIDSIPEEYFLDFLKFIDQYPTIFVSIDILEQ